jgi:hypothetical protein
MDIYKEQKRCVMPLKTNLQIKEWCSRQQYTGADEAIEKDLLNKGFNKQTLQRTIDVKQEL